MSDGKIFTRLKSGELREELQQAFKKSKPQNRVMIVLKKLVANIILNNNEISSLMPDIIPLMKIDNLEIRKMCFHFIVAYARVNPKEAYEALPFLSRFKDESSPILRSLALRTLSSVPNKEFVEVTFNCIKYLLKDLDPHVRKGAAFAVSRLYQYDPKRTEAENLIDDLNDLLYDSNQVVVSNALAALSSITEQSKTLSLTIDKSHSLTLISHLSNTNEWCQIYILNSLISYVPQTTEEATELIEAVIPTLQHENSSVVLNAIKAIVYYCNYVRSPELVIPTLSKRLGSSLASLLSKPAEIQFLVLRNVILLLLGRRELINVDVEMFFCRYDDPIYVKDTKLEIIYLLANEKNVHTVLRELEEYATEVDVAMARKAIRAFGNLAVKLPNAADECVNVICDLASNGISYIVQESVIAIKNITRKYPGRFNFAIDELVKHYKLVDEPDAKTAMIWILGQNCDTISESAVILEEFISNFKDDPIEVQYVTLTAATKLYLKVPEKGEALVLKVLKWATEDVDNPDIRDRGYMYWRLLSSEHASGNEGNFQEVTKSIILNDKPLISADNDSIDVRILEELELSIGTLASIYLKPLQHVFRLSNKKTLRYSPALQERQIQKKNVSETPDPNTLAVTKPSIRRRGSSSLRVHTVNTPESARSGRLSVPRKASFESESSADDYSKKDSFAKRISRKASIITRKGGKF